MNRSTPAARYLASLAPGFPARITVRDDVGRVEQVFVPEPAEGALAAVGVDHTFAEGLRVT